MGHTLVPCALSVSDVDALSATGITADVKTFCACGVFGASVSTGVLLSSQTEHEGERDGESETKSVVAFDAVVTVQLASALEQLNVKAVKAAGASTTTLTSVILPTLAKHHVTNVVVDITNAQDMSEMTWHHLMTDHVTLLVAKVTQVENFTNVSKETTTPPDHLKAACRAVFSSSSPSSSPAILVVDVGSNNNSSDNNEPKEQQSTEEEQNKKGTTASHVTGVLYHEGKFHEISIGPYVDVVGVSETLSAAIVAFLALGCDVISGVRNAELFVRNSIKTPLKVGSQLSVPNHFHALPQPHIATTSLFERLKSAASEEWEEYIYHPFLKQLAAGTLPLECFQHYITQDYIFLVHYARANALLCYKADDVSDMLEAADCMGDIVKVELDLHAKLCESWGISKADLQRTPESRANMAYTRFVLERGLSGDLLDLKVAMAACVIGYSIIGQKLLSHPDTVLEGNTYREWIETYAGEWFQVAAQRAIEHLDKLAQKRGLSQERFDQLVRTFRDAVKLEVGFWQMALALEK